MLRKLSRTFEIGRARLQSCRQGFENSLGASESVSQPKVPLESGITSRKLAAKRRKNAAHGASRGWKVENDRAPEERKKGCDTDSEARAVGAGSDAALKRRSSTATPGFC